MVWFNYFHEELDECIRSITNNHDVDRIYLYEIRKYAYHNGFESGEWFIEDLSSIPDYLYNLSCEIIVSSKDIDELDKLAILNF